MVYALKIFATLVDLLLLAVLSMATIPLKDKSSSHRVSYITFVIALGLSVLSIWLV